MGLLIEGRWHDQWYESSADGAFQRERASRPPPGLTASPAPAARRRFKAEAGRYPPVCVARLPVGPSHADPAQLKGLEGLIDVSVVSWLMLENGWTFDKARGSSGDSLDGFAFMHQRYTADTADYTGASRCRCCGTNNSSASSAMNQRRSSACSTARSTG